MIAGPDALAQFGGAFAQALLSSLWLGAVVALAVGLFVRLHRGLNAASRHAAWYVALLVITLLPMVSMVSSLARLSVTMVHPAPPQAERLVVLQTDSHIKAAKTTASSLPFGSAQDAGASAPSAASPLSASISPALAERIALIAAAVVAAIAFIRIAFLMSGLWGLARVKRESRVVDPSLSPTLARTMARDAGARAVHLRLSETIDTPAAAGFRSPAILLPVELVDALDADSLDQIAMHEYAHLRRYDDWTNLFQRVIERLYWFNPAIWFVGGRIDLEREIACDDWAVAGAGGATRYADCLWQLAQDGRVPSFAATAPGAFLTRNQIAARIEHLLQRHRDGAPTLRAARLALMAPLVAAAFALVAGRAPAIALHVVAPAVSHPAAIGLRLAPLSSNAISQMFALAPAPSASHCPFALLTDAALTNAATNVARRAQLGAIASANVASANVAAANVASANVATTNVAAANVAAANAAAANGAHANAAAHVARRAQLGADRASSAQIALLPQQALSAVVKTLADKSVAAAAANAAAAAEADRQATIHAAMAQAIEAHIHPHVKIDVRTQAGIETQVAGKMAAAIAHQPAPVIAAAIETDNLSFGPNDRNVLAHCTGCDLSNRDLRNVDLHGLVLTGDDLSGSDLRGANLRGTVFTGVDLSGAKLDGADLRGASFTGSDIDGASFVNAKTDGIRIVGMQITNAILSAASARAILSSCAGCDLSGLDLRGRDLHGITLDGADMHGVDLSNANLQGARFNGVDLSGVRFTNTDLRNTQFNGCDLRDVDLDHAQTQGMQLQGSQMNSDSSG